MNKLFLVFTAGLWAVLGLVSDASSAPSLPGDPLGSTSYVIAFNANGGGFYATLIPEGSIDGVQNQGVILDGFLAFELPTAVITGDVAFESNNGAIATGLRFLEENGAYYMEVFAPYGYPFAPSQTGFPSDFDFSFVGGAAQGSMDYIAYYGSWINPSLSPHMWYEGFANVPEPSTWAMMLAGFAGLGLAGFRRAREPRAVV
jgi:PEP-CTERM motif